MREGVVRLLESDGEVQVAAISADLDSLLAAVEKHEPDVLVTDIQMEGMNGRELCRAVRARYPGNPFLILVMTSMTASEERVWVRELAQVEFLEKPLSPRQLVARLAAHFAATATQQEKLDASAS